MKKNKNNNFYNHDDVDKFFEGVQEAASKFGPAPSCQPTPQWTEEELKAATIIPDDMKVKTGIAWREALNKNLQEFVNNQNNYKK